MVSDITDNYHHLDSTQAGESKQRKSMLAVSTKLTSNLSYIVPSFALEVNAARKKAGLKVVTEENIEQSPFKPKRIAVALSSIPGQSGITFKCTIWTRLPEKPMIRGGPTQWWNMVLTTSVESYSNYLHQEAEKHAGWKERPQRESSKIDINTTRPILIGLMEAKGSGDPTTISVPEGGGTWQDLFRLIPGFLADSPPPITRGPKKQTLASHSQDRSIALVLPVTFKSATKLPSLLNDSREHLSANLVQNTQRLSIREQEKIKSEKTRVASKAKENIFIKKNSRRRSHEIKKIESDSENEQKGLILTKKQDLIPLAVSISSSNSSSQLLPIIQNPIHSSNTLATLPPRTPPKSIVIGRLKRSRSIVSPPTLKNLGNRKPKRGREFDVVRNAVVEYELDQRQGQDSLSSSNIYDILHQNNPELLVEEETDIDTDNDLNI